MNSARTLTDRVVDTVYYQTAPNQPESVTLDTIKTVLCANGREDPIDVENAVDDAVRKGRLVEIDGKFKVA